MVCPHGHTFVADAALLFYQSGQEPPLVFSPAETATAAQNRQAAAGYCAWLAAALGRAWRDEWVDDTLAIPRHALAHFLSDTPVLAALQAVLQLPPVGETLAAIHLVLAEEGVDPQTGDAFFDAVAARPELSAALSAAIEAALAGAAPSPGATPPTGEGTGPAGRKRRIGKRKGRR